jgi:hypothetical protein
VDVPKRVVGRFGGRGSFAEFCRPRPFPKWAFWVGRVSCLTVTWSVKKISSWGAESQEFSAVVCAGHGARCSGGIRCQLFGDGIFHNLSREISRVSSINQFDQSPESLSVLYCQASYIQGISINDNIYFVWQENTPYIKLGLCMKSVISAALHQRLYPLVCRNRNMLRTVTAARRPANKKAGFSELIFNVVRVCISQRT